MTENLTTCNLCKQSFEKSDPDLNIRKKRHEEKHTRGKNHKGRSNGGGNNILGEVIWI